MSVKVRIRNGMEPDGYGNGGVSEGDYRGSTSDIINGGGVVDKDGGHALVHEASSPGMSVVVDPGVVYIENAAFDETDSDSIKAWEAVIAGNTASRTLAISSNSSGQTRIDLICVAFDPGEDPDSEASDVAELIVVNGTPGSGVPATPDYYTALGKVTVANGETEITNAEITDLRTQIKFNSQFIPDTLTGIRTTKKVVAITSSATPSPNCDTADIFDITALAAAAAIANPTGTPVDGQTLIFRIKDNGTARALTWGTDYREVGVVLPDTTVINKTLYVGTIYNANADKFDVVAVNQEF